MPVVADAQHDREPKSCSVENLKLASQLNYGHKLAFNSVPTKKCLASAILFSS